MDLDEFCERNPDGDRYSLSREGIADLYALARDEGRLSIRERVSLVLALLELAHYRERTGRKRCAGRRR